MELLILIAKGYATLASFAFLMIFGVVRRSEAIHEIKIQEAVELRAERAEELKPQPVPKAKIEVLPAPGE